MEPRITTLLEKKLVGKRLLMTIRNDKTFELWQSFMPIVKDIKDRANRDLYCLQIYDNSLNFKDFTQDTEYEKWAAAEVIDFSHAPKNTETYTLKGGLYAVFTYKGLAADFDKMFHSIFDSWLPKSRYALDDREHFFVMGDKYKNNDPNSEEDFWVPIRIR
jgi:AraC family transcriptional regulator